MHCSAVFLADDHDDLTLAGAVELAEKNTLPATQHEFAVFERNSYARPDEAGFEVSIRIFFAMTKAHAMLWNQSSEGVQHIARHVRVGVLVDGESRSGVLHVENDDAFLRTRFFQLLSYFISELDEFFALVRTDFQNVHGENCTARRRPQRHRDSREVRRAKRRILVPTAGVGFSGFAA